jgi:DNA-binding protein YbaB
MFGKLKDLNNLRQQAGQMQAMLAGEQVEAENHGIKVVMNGNQEVLEVTINSELGKEEQEKYLRETFNEAVKKVQRLMATKMMGMM